MVASLNDLGYTVEWRILNAAEYGFPQRRRRIFIIGYLSNTPIDKKRKVSNQKDWITSLGVLGKSFPCVEKNSNTEFVLTGDLEKISNTTFSKNGKSSFYNSGISINRKVYSIDVKKETVKWKMTLGDVIEKNIKKIPEEFWVDEKDHKKWNDVKGAKQKERTSKSGHKYMFSEGKMETLDKFDKPSRTIITSEGGKTPSRVKHLIEQDIQSNVWGDNVLSTFNSANLLDKFEFNVLKNYIITIANQFLKHLESDNIQLKIDSSWINYYKTNQYQSTHHHLPSSKISGVYYLKTNEQDGNLVFHRSMYPFPFGKNPSNLLQEFFEYTPKVGRIILFPSWAQHSVNANMTEDTRISISFNLI
jgi:uncharacterized protein (TIGR02466 family)